MNLSGKMFRLVGAVLIAIPLVSILISVAGAVPIFSRKYQTSCSTCHYAFPQLNAFGKAFLNNGWRYPGGDANFRKEEPVSLGSEAYKQVWPNAIWPSDIPGAAPLMARLNENPNVQQLVEKRESGMPGFIAATKIRLARRG